MPYVKGRFGQMSLSLTTLVGQTVPADALVIVNDGDNDFVDSMSVRHGPAKFHDFIGALCIIHMRPEGLVRPPNAAIRHGFSCLKPQGLDYIIVWYPEILAPPFAIEAMLSRHVQGHRDVAPVLALSEAQTMALLAVRATGKEDITRWDVLDPWARSDPNFLSTETPLRITNAEAHGNIHHLNFSGAMWSEWERFGFMPETDNLGQEEQWLREKEVAAGYLPRATPFSVYHQWHPRLFPVEERRSTRIDRIHGGRDEPA
jgi:hypothetical protein